MNVQSELHTMHSYLMYKKFPYHSVSVIHRPNDLGLHVMFMESVKDLVTDEVKQRIKSTDFTYSFVKNNL